MFDTAFAAQPNQRPSANQWRRALFKAVEGVWVHRCGAAFVLTPKQTLCPFCREVPPKRPEGRGITPLGAITLRINGPTGASLDLALADGQGRILGRNNLPGASSRVSARHLELRRFGDRLFLRHHGRNPTIDRASGVRIVEDWRRLDALKKTPLTLRLADVDVVVTAFDPA